MDLFNLSLTTQTNAQWVWNRDWVEATDHQYSHTENNSCVLNNLFFNFHPFHFLHCVHPCFFGIRFSENQRCHLRILREMCRSMFVCFLYIIKRTWNDNDIQSELIELLVLNKWNESAMNNHIHFWRLVTKQIYGLFLFFPQICQRSTLVTVQCNMRRRHSHEGVSMQNLFGIFADIGDAAQRQFLCGPEAAAARWTMRHGAMLNGLWVWRFLSKVVVHTQRFIWFKFATSFQSKYTLHGHTFTIPLWKSNNDAHVHTSPSLILFDVLFFSMWICFVSITRWIFCNFFHVENQMVGIR